MSHNKKAVFVASTYKEFENIRRRLWVLLLGYDLIVRGMETFGARTEPSLDTCLSEVEQCDYFLLVVGYSYGTLDGSSSKSYTQREYEKARDTGKIILPYLPNETKYTTLPQYIDSRVNSRKLNAFKFTLKREHNPDYFDSEDDLIEKVTRQFNTLLSKRPGTPPGILIQPPDDWVSPAMTNHQRFKVAAFDFDGTLLRARKGEVFNFSWEFIRKHLNIDESIAEELERRYRREVRSDPSRRTNAYQDWCERVCDLYKARMVTRTWLENLCNDHLKLTANCLKGLAELRSKGIVTALISGGIDAFYESMFREKRDCFDFVFINKLTFNNLGFLDGVQATPFDLEGKANALEIVCRRVGCAADAEAVFVGDRWNEDSIVLMVSKVIAYPPTDGLVARLPTVKIKEDDMMLVVREIIDQQTINMV